MKKVKISQRFNYSMLSNVRDLNYNLTISGWNVWTLSLMDQPIKIKLKTPKLLSYWIRKRHNKKLWTCVINISMAPPSFWYNIKYDYLIICGVNRVRSWGINKEHVRLVCLYALKQRRLPMCSLKSLSLWREMKSEN